MIKYRIHTEKYDHFLPKLEKFTSKVMSDEPDILEYNIFQAPDKYSFVHYISYANGEAEQKHLKGRYVKRFNKKILECALDEPMYIELNSFGQAQGLVPDAHYEESQQSIDTSLYRTEREVGIINKLT